MSPAIHKYAAGICVNSSEQSPERVEQADNENARAEHLQIFWDETNPEFFAGADREDGEQQNHEVAFESEKLSDSLT
jgi:hypothetical protein